MDNRRITQKELSELWCISESKIEHWRSDGNGPPYLKLGAHIRYRMTDIIEYEEKCLITTALKEGK